MDNAVAIAAIGLAASSIGGLIWLAKFVANTLGKDLQEHTKAAVEQTKSAEKQIRTLDKLEKTIVSVGRHSQENLQFMKNLNGKLAKATIQTVKEQHVEKQVIEERTKNGV